MDRKEYKRQWRLANRDKVAAHSKKWVAANLEKRRAIEKDWRSRNPDKVAAHNKKAGAKWAKANRGLRMASVRARQAAKLQRTPLWADREAMKLFYVEAQRLSETTGVPHEVDHIYPLQGEFVSGLHVAENLQILTRFANRSKGNK